MMDLQEILNQADSLLGSTVRMWPIGMPRLPNKQFGIKNPDTESLYQKVLECAPADSDSIRHKAYLGLGELYCFLVSRILTPPHSEGKAYNALRQAYSLRPLDDETRYMFSWICHEVGTDDEAPVKHDSKEFKRLREKISTELDNRWYSKAA